MKIAVVGVTGLVGTVMCEVLEEQNFPITEFLPVASTRSVGKIINFQGKDHTVISMEAAVEARPDIAIFSAGGNVSLEWAPLFAEVGTTVIDNSSAWRMDPTKKLVVPEINGHLLTKEDKIIRFRLSQSDFLARVGYNNLISNGFQLCKVVSIF